MRLVWKIIVPLVIVVLGALGARGLSSLRERPRQVPVAPYQPVVDVISVIPQTQSVNVFSHGVVAAREQSTLVAEVTGRIVETRVDAGAWVAADAVLALIDPADYQAAVASATAELREAERVLAVEQAAAVRAAREWELVGDGDASALTLREPQVAAAQARVAALVAAKERAQRDLERCEVRAPFAGRIIQRSVSLGERVAPGQVMVEIEAADAVEVVVPIPLDQLAWLDLPVHGEVLAPGVGTPADVQATIAGHSLTWRGHVVRVRGQLDAGSRMLEAVVQIPQVAPGADGPPLLTGLFVDVVLHGRERDGLATIPSTALQPGDGLWAVRPHPRLPRFADALPESGSAGIDGCLTFAAWLIDVARDGWYTPGDGELVAVEAELLRRGAESIVIAVPATSADAGADADSALWFATLPVPGGREGMPVRVRSWGQAK